jgi:uncharacterized protein YdcH (DUF465 family)
MKEQQIKEILIDSDSEFKVLFVKHQELEDKLQHVLHKKQKSDEEQVMEQNLKKEKLQLKDAMQKRIIAFKKKGN